MTHVSSIPNEIDTLLSKLPVAEQEALLAEVDEYRKALERETAQASFMAYIKMMAR